jgi:hypothetical protein
MTVNPAAKCSKLDHSEPKAVKERGRGCDGKTVRVAVYKEIRKRSLREVNGTRIAFMGKEGLLPFILLQPEGA